MSLGSIGIDDLAISFSEAMTHRAGAASAALVTSSFNNQVLPCAKLSTDLMRYRTQRRLVLLHCFRLCRGMDAAISDDSRAALTRRDAAQAKP